MHRPILSIAVLAAAALTACANRQMVKDEDSPFYSVPDSFVVTKIVDQSEDVATGWPTFAALGMGIVFGDGPVHLTFSTTMYLESKVQPDVYRLTCQRWDWPNIGEYLSINEMRQALGDYFTLILAE